MATASTRHSVCALWMLGFLHFYMYGFIHLYIYDHIHLGFIHFYIYLFIISVHYFLFGVRCLGFRV